MLTSLLLQLEKSKKISKLELPENYNFQVAGIICGFKNYRFCHELNQCLGFSMIRADDVVMPTGRPGSNTLHATYEVDADEFHKCLLVTNKDSGFSGYMVPELKNIDYFFIYEGSGKIEEFNICLSKLRISKMVTGVYRLDPAELKSADAFFILLES